GKPDSHLSAAIYKSLPIPLNTITSLININKGTAVIIKSFTAPHVIFAIAGKEDVPKKIKIPNILVVPSAKPIGVPVTSKIPKMSKTDKITITQSIYYLLLLQHQSSSTTVVSSFINRPLFNHQSNNLQ